MKTILVTGGCGFIGSTFIKKVLSETKAYNIINVDALSYAGNVNNIESVQDDKRYRFYHCEIQDKVSMEDIFADNNIYGVINFAAHTHVDRSIIDSTPFVTTNIQGTQVLLDLSIEYKIARYIQISTDEVYGSIDKDSFTEESPLMPNNPYSAAKAAGDLLVRSYVNTYKFPGIVTRCCNNYGPNQFPEKLIPVMIRNAYHDLPLPIYGDGSNVREWIYVDDHCEAILKIFKRGTIGEIYNIGGFFERSNLEVVKTILKYIKKPMSLIKYVEDRKGHDFRYSINDDKLYDELGFMCKTGFREGMRKTIKWYIDNREWLYQENDN